MESRDGAGTGPASREGGGAEPCPGGRGERFQALVESGGDLFWETDLAGRYVYASPSAAHLLGYAAGELTGRDIRDLLLEEDRPALEEVLARSIALRQGWTGLVLRRRHRGGTTRWLECDALPILDAEGGLLGFRGTERDVTRQVRTELALREAFSLAASERSRAESILASLPDGISIQDHAYRVIFQNPAHELLLGRHRGEICYRAYEGREEICEGCPVALALADGTTHKTQRIIGEGETARHFEMSASPLRDAEGTIIAGIECFREITARRRTEEALQRSEQRFKELADSLPEPIFECDLAGTISYANRMAVASLGYRTEELVGMSMFAVLVPQDRERARIGMRGRLDGTRDEHDEYTALRKDGSTFPIAVQARAILREGRAVGLRGVVIDLTERRRVEAERLRAQKLESIGILAGGIAHDFNNLLTGILGNISLAKLRAARDEALAARLEEAEKASLHARELTLQLLTFAKGGAPVRRPVALEPLLRDAAQFALHGASVRLAFRIAPALPAVDADEGQLGQVVQNLVLNACQAMPAGGTVTVAAAAVELETGSGVPLPPGRYVRVEVTDEGAGIAAEHLPRVFDPYFTTKPQGSGLGLAVSYSVVRNHGGHIAVSSLPGGGTTFTIHLPASGAAPAAVGQGEEGIAAGGRGRILVMDDEAIVREVAGAMLEECGYETAFAADGAEALARWREAREGGHPFDAVIVDLTVPGGMGGREAVELMKAVDPQVKAVVSSGYSNDPVMADYRNHGFQGVVTKPYRVRDLAQVLRQVLGARGAGGTSS